MATKEGSVSEKITLFIQSYEQKIAKGQIYLIPVLYNFYEENKMYAEKMQLSQVIYEKAKNLSATNPEKALILCEYAAKLGRHYESMCILFDHYVYTGMQKNNLKLLTLVNNIYKSAEYYEKMAESNADQEIRFKFYDRAIELYDRARTHGDVNALYRLARCCENSPKPQRKIAIILYEKASNQKHVDAMCRLSEIYVENIDPVDPQKRISLANKLYEEGQFYQCFTDLDNKIRAFKLFECATKLGHVKAMDQLFNPCFNEIRSKEPIELPIVEVEPKEERKKKTKPSLTVTKENLKGNLDSIERKENSSSNISTNPVKFLQTIREIQAVNFSRTIKNIR